MIVVIYVEGDVVIFVIVGVVVVFIINFNIVVVDGSFLSSYVDVDGLGLDEYYFFLLLFFGEYFFVYGKYSFEFFFVFGSVVVKFFDECVFYVVFNFLLFVVQSGDFGCLFEGCLMVIEWFVDNCFLNVEKVVLCDVF